MRLAFYKAADAFAAREGRAPDKPEQRRLLAQVLTEEDAPRGWGAAALVRTGGDEATSRLRLDANLAKAPKSVRPIPAATLEGTDGHDGSLIAGSRDASNSDGQRRRVGSTGGHAGTRRRRYLERRGAEHLDQIEISLRERAQSWRTQGRVRAAYLLEKFLDGDDSPVFLSREEAREIEFVRIGEAENNRRFIEDTFTGKTKNPKITECLRTLQDGEQCNIKDHYDYERNKLNSLGLGLFHYTQEQVPGVERAEELDEILSFGSHEVKSKIVFTARRTGDVIRIKGVITHSASDNYNFEKGTPGHLVGARRLQEVGRASPYTIESVWYQEVEGQVTIRRTKVGITPGSRIYEHVLENPQFRVRDMERQGKADE